MNNDRTTPGRTAQHPSERSQNTRLVAPISLLMLPAYRVVAGRGRDARGHIEPVNRQAQTMALGYTGRASRSTDATDGARLNGFDDRGLDQNAGPEWRRTSGSVRSKRPRSSWPVIENNIGRESGPLLATHSRT